MDATPHVEVVPRIVDNDIAATYNKKQPEVKSSKQSTPDNALSTVATAGVAIAKSSKSNKFFATIKEYLMPAIFVICLIIIICILWKYFTKYRKEKSNVGASNVPPPKTLPESANEDLSKYMTDSESGSVVDYNHDDMNLESHKIEEIHDGEEKEDDLPELETIDEDEDEDGESDTESESPYNPSDLGLRSNQVSDIDDEESVMSVDTFNNFDMSHIHSLINEEIEATEMPVLENDEDQPDDESDSIEVHDSQEDTTTNEDVDDKQVDTEEHDQVISKSKVTKRSKKSKRLTV